MPSILTRLLSVLQRWFGWEWAVLVVRRDDDVRTLKLPEDLPVSVRENTDGSVGLTVGHHDHGEALLVDLRALMGGACSPVQSEMTRQEPSRTAWRDR
jgi:hypothetical protein